MARGQWLSQGAIMNMQEYPHDKAVLDTSIHINQDNFTILVLSGLNRACPQHHCKVDEKRVVCDVFSYTDAPPKTVCDVTLLFCFWCERYHLSICYDPVL